MKHPGFLFLLLILACPNVIAQLSHQTISSQLHSKQIGNYTIVGIVGQNSPTGTFKQSQATFFQGFLHYNMYSIENLDQFSQQTGISVYPNPFSSTINIAFPQAQKSVEKLLDKGKLLILLDGLDEVPTKNMDRVINKIQDFVDKHDKNRFLISCRTAAYNN